MRAMSVIRTFIEIHIRIEFVLFDEAIIWRCHESVICTSSLRALEVDIKANEVLFLAHIVLYRVYSILAIQICFFSEHYLFFTISFRGERPSILEERGGEGGSPSCRDNP